MASTVFVNQVTPIVADWLNDVNDKTYKHAVSIEAYGAVGDGVVNDTVAIQNALNSGYDIFIPKTNNYYLITSALTFFSDNQRILGEGVKSQIRQTTSLANVIEANGKSGVVVDSVKLYAVGDRSTYANGAGVLFTSCNKSVVRNCTVENHRGGGVVIYNSDDCVAQGNWFINSPVTNGQDDTFAFADVAVVYNSKRNNVSLNHCISGQGTGVLVQSVVDPDACDFNMVTNNIINNCKVYGIAIYRNSQSLPALQSVLGTIVSGNIINNTTGKIVNSITATFTYGAGIYIQGAEGTVVTGNTVTSSHSGGETYAETLAPGAIGVTNVTRVVISDNMIKTAGMFGIDIGDGNIFGDTTGHGVVTNNQITSCTRGGIHVRRRGRIKIADNTIDTTGDSGIEVNNISLTNSLGINITGNIVRNTTGTAAIEVKFGERVNIVGNSTEISNTHGIAALDSKDVAINSNLIHAHTSRGIQFTSTCTGALVARNNTIVGTGSSTGGIKLDVPVEYSDNRISGCTSLYEGNFGPYQTLTVNNTTPSVADGKEFITNNTSPTTISNFTGGTPGQEIIVVFTDANTTLDFTSSNLKGNVGADRAMAAGDAITAVFRQGVNAWYVTIIDIA